jgi:hypothetical protein
MECNSQLADVMMCDTVASPVYQPVSMIVHQPCISRSAALHHPTNFAQQTAHTTTTTTACRHMGSSMELVPALQQPAASPADPDPAAPSLLAVMQRLHTQCSIFKKSAEQLGEGDEEDIAALSLALEMSSMFEDLKADVDMYALAMGSQAQQVRTACCDSLGWLRRGVTCIPVAVSLGVAMHAAF